MIESEHVITQAATKQQPSAHLVNINTQKVDELIQSKEEEIDSDNYKKIVVGPPAERLQEEPTN